MPIDPLLTAIMLDTITVESVVARPGTPALNGYGMHATGGVYEYGSPKVYKCYIENVVTVMTDLEGRNRVSKGRAFLAGYFPTITSEDRLTMTDQSQDSLRHPSIVSVNHSDDEYGQGYNTVLYFD